MYITTIRLNNTITEADAQINKFKSNINDYLKFDKLKDGQNEE